MGGPEDVNSDVVGGSEDVTSDPPEKEDPASESGGVQVA